MNFPDETEEGYSSRKESNYRPSHNRASAEEGSCSIQHSGQGD